MTNVIKHRDLAIRAMRAAVEMRKAALVRRDDPLCVFDVAERVGVEVKFVDAPSLEGMYSRDERGTILLPSLQHRPAGRIAFSCGHELGHHTFDHGTRVDEYLKDSPRNRDSDPEEWIADCFAGFLLMPHRAVEDSLKRRGFTISKLAPRDVYVVAGELGVGYKSLLSHLRWSLKLLSSAAEESLARAKLSDIRNDILPDCSHQNLKLVDLAWKSSAVAADLRVGDAAILPPGVMIEGNCVRRINARTSSVVVEGIMPGRARAISDDGKWSVFIRVARAAYVGRAIFRHLEEPDEHS